jgi:16S rRNA (adenine1518-N6/adenine1519-N6)-dimethyltransferase
MRVGAKIKLLRLLPRSSEAKRKQHGRRNKSALPKASAVAGRPLGQHFLRDTSVIERILQAAQLTPQDQVLEIGPGRGALTAPMLLTGCSILALEVDPELARRLSGSERLKVLHKDFLDWDFSDWQAGPEPGKVVANLPYYITTPILEKLLTSSDGRFSDMWLMMQHEVAERIVTPGKRSSGSLTHFVRYYAQADYLFRIPPAAFSPPPEVDSAVVHFRFTGPPPDSSAKQFFRILRQAFAQRRKMLRTSLKGILQDHHFEQAQIEAQRRPETLSFEEFLALERVSR